MTWKLAFDFNMLARHCGIPLHKAKRTVQCTTQCGVKNIAILSRICTNDFIFQYHHLHHTIFTNTMFASTQSRHGNKYAQIFSSDFRWLCTYPIMIKGKAHDTLPLMFQHEDVPPLMVMDGSKEQTLGKFCEKLCNASCEKIITESYSPWQNATQLKIKELKKGAGKKLLLTNMPRRLWDDCLECEAYVRSHMAHDIFK